MVTDYKQTLLDIISKRLYLCDRDTLHEALLNILSNMSEADLANIKVTELLPPSSDNDNDFEVTYCEEVSTTYIILHYKDVEYRVIHSPNSFDDYMNAPEWSVSDITGNLVNSELHSIIVSFVKIYLSKNTH